MEEFIYAQCCQAMLQAGDPAQLRRLEEYLTLCCEDDEDRRQLMQLLSVRAGKLGRRSAPDPDPPAAP